MSEDTSRVWLITGASSGFGKRMVIAVLARGIAVSFWGHIDILVNNAGVGLPGLMEEGGTKLLRRQLEANLFGVLDVTDAALPHLRQSKSPCLVVIGSRSAWKDDFPGLGHYAASKAAVHAVTEAFMSELAQFNIKVLLVQPGAFPTEGINGQIFFTENPIKEYDAMRTATKNKFSSIDGTQKGDPNKAVEAIVDVVKGEGVAKGRPWPGYLFLGEDAEFDVRKRCTKVLNILDEWADVTRGVNFDSLPAAKG
ncbi:hypothetical protein CPB84DRAFT_1778858 [Gymnopilus junonius]|uniref:Uncharacterized protein n=1 Tax=Gymnopilus junonius TaxID=109634 RepID=A0A9P5NPJ2_GYMJU|nr:hypothetical protein CPB84DRAFT_1778858 [Gymnopilus junonius]